MVRTQTSPLAQLLSVWDLNERNLMLAAQSNDEFLVRLLLARLVQHAHVCLASVERFAGLTQAARQPVVDQGDLEHALQCVEYGHAAAARGRRRIFADFYLLRGGHLGVGWLFSVRLWARVLVDIASVYRDGAAGHGWYGDGHGRAECTVYVQTARSSHARRDLPCHYMPGGRGVRLPS